MGTIVPTHYLELVTAKNKTTELSLIQALSGLAEQAPVLVATLDKNRQNTLPADVDRVAHRESHVLDCDAYHIGGEQRGGLTGNFGPQKESTAQTVGRCEVLGVRDETSEHLPIGDSRLLDLSAILDLD